MRSLKSLTLAARALISSPPLLRASASAWMPLRSASMVSRRACSCLTRSAMPSCSFRQDSSSLKLMTLPLPALPLRVLGLAWASTAGAMANSDRLAATARADREIERIGKQSLWEGSGGRGGDRARRAGRRLPQALGAAGDVGQP